MISIAGIMSLYGLTWIFGALTIDKASFAFQVIFVVLNSLQGFFIYLFLCVLSRDGRELWLELLFCGRYKSSHLHPSSAVSSSGDKKANNNMLLMSDNTSATPAPVVEKSISAEPTSGTYVVNYIEFSEKSSNRDVAVVADIGDRTPETASVTSKEEIEDSQKLDELSLTSIVGNEHLLENGREAPQDSVNLHTMGETDSDNGYDPAIEDDDEDTDKESPE